ncbi:MAG: nucleic acid-binding protein [Dehalococcoidia bacterium]|nr:nucleic acid-binding protein [Dehalococcoidia bacterium]
MPDALVDTDVFVDHLRGAREFHRPDARVSYSVVTRCELFAGSRVDESVVSLLLGPFTEIPVTRDIAERAGRLRRLRDIPMADALIAASALEWRLTLVTRNLRHFQQVPDLEIRAPEDPRTARSSPDVAEGDTSQRR